jgi:hypothetical protein
LIKNRRRLHRSAGEPVELREEILYVRVLQPALHYKLGEISKAEIVRKLKQRFGSKTICDVPLPRRLTRCPDRQFLLECE